MPVSADIYHKKIDNLNVQLINKDLQVQLIRHEVSVILDR